MALSGIKYGAVGVGVGRIEGSGSQRRGNETLGSSGGLGVGERDWVRFFFSFRFFPPFFMSNFDFTEFYFSIS